MPAAPIVMPKLGLTMTEGLIAEWQVGPGDDVVPGQILFVVETDKISNEIEAPGPGRIVELLVDAGATVPVGTAVALWTGQPQGRATTAADSAPATSAAEAGAGPAKTAPTGVTAPAGLPTREQRRQATPFARRLAALHGIALAEITGSGPRGRIQARDVQARLDRETAAPPPDRPALPPLPPLPALGPGGPPPAPARPAGQRNLRQLIAARVSRAKAEIPHFYVAADAGFDALAELRSDLNADPAAPRRISVTALLMMVVARALGRHPHANAVWRNGDLAPLDHVAIGLAVDTPAGVMAPVVPVTGGLYTLAAAIDGAVERARGGRLTAADAGEAAIGISNVGMFNVRALTPIIDPDQSFMLGVGAPHVAFRAAEDGAARAVRQVTLTLACDHRVIDGAAAARLLADIVALIEHPARLIAA